MQKQRSLAGPFAVKQMGEDSWQLTEPAGAQILMRGARADAAVVLKGDAIDSLNIEWLDDGVRLALAAAGRVRMLAFDCAIIHEPQSHLYESLPLAAFDSDARRFWKRVFGLIRLPGGRFLVGLLARGGRAKPKA